MLHLWSEARIQSQAQAGAWVTMFLELLYGTCYSVTSSCLLQHHMATQPAPSSMEIYSRWPLTLHPRQEVPRSRVSRGKVPLSNTGCGTHVREC